MTLKDFSELTQILQSFLISFGVIAGGIWALYRFKSLKELDKAKFELETLKQSIERHGHLNIEISTQEMGLYEVNQRLIQVNVTVNNIGNRTEILNWNDDSGITIARVVGFKDSNIQLDEWRDIKLIGWRGERVTSSISPGHKKVYNFMLPVSKSGHYYILFKVKGSIAETEFNEVLMAKDKVKNDSGPILWAAEIFINVETNIA